MMYRQAAALLLLTNLLNVNRGVAYSGGVVYRGTADGHVLAIDASTGQLRWDVTIADPGKGESVPMAPLAWNDLVFVGRARGDVFGVTGRVYGLDAASGRTRRTGAARRVRAAVIRDEGPTALVTLERSRKSARRIAFQHGAVGRVRVWRGGRRARRVSARPSARGTRSHRALAHHACTTSKTTIAEGRATTRSQGRGAR